MMNKFLLMFAALIFLGAGGCATVTDEDGNTYRALSSSDRENLIETCRLTLIKHQKKGLITAQECAFARYNKPEFQVKYRGDRFGTAKIAWYCGKRKLEFIFHDDLTAKIPVCQFAITDIPEHRQRSVRPDKSVRGR